MTTCPTCGQSVEDARDKLHRNLFVWTSTAIFMWVTWLSCAEWTVAWWAARWRLEWVMAVPTVGAIVYWVKFLRTRKRRCP